MPSYIGVPTETDPDVLSERALAFLVEKIPGFVPRDGHLEVWLVMALARMVAEARDVASRVPTEIFRYFGQSLLGLAPIDDTPASVLSTWTMIDAAGYTVPAGTLAGFRAAGDEVVAFVVRDTFTVPPGSTATAAGAVALDALDDGEGGNGFGPGAMELIDALAFVSTIAATTTSGGGVDAETDAAYLNRLVDELSLMSPRPILPGDFAIIARRVPGVYRATAIDGYNPGDLSYGNERMVTVAVVDENGDPVGATIKTAVDDLLEAEREVSFIIHVIDPTYTAIDVDFDVSPTLEADAATVRTAIIDAITDYLSPATWGGGNEVPPVWRNETVIRYLELAALINAVPGVDFIRTLTVEGGTANVTLTGAAPLPQPGLITGSVTR